MQTLGPGMPLNMDLSFRSTAVVLPNAELYFGVQVPGGAVFYLNSSGVFASAIAPAYRGPLPSFGPGPLLRIPDASSRLAKGVYLWFTFVDHNADALLVPGEEADFVVTVIQ